MAETDELQGLNPMLNYLDPSTKDSERDHWLDMLPDEKLNMTYVPSGIHGPYKQLIWGNERSDQHQSTPLHHACKHGFVGFVGKLIKRKARVDLQNCAGDTAMHVAASYGNVDIVKLVRFYMDLYLNVFNTGRLIWV